MIRLDALTHNLERIRAAAPGTRVLAVVKADAYGHGILGCLPALDATDAFAVACVSEGVELRAAGVEHPIVVLEGAMDADDLAAAKSHRLELVVHEEGQVRMLAAGEGAAKTDVWLKIDTGMNRLGFRADQAQAAWERLRALPAVGMVRLMTHLACADLPDDPMTVSQCERFEAVTRDWPGERSIANSAGVFAHPATHADWVRPGLSLYGVSPFAGSTGTDLGLRQVMTLKAALISVRDVLPGERVGYGGDWVAERPTRVAVVGIGYGDGYPREPGAGAAVMLDGVRCPLVGRVSMDMLAVDVSPCPRAQTGDQVVLWGEGLPVEEVAERAGTIPWTLLCAVTERVSRAYLIR